MLFAEWLSNIIIKGFLGVFFLLFSFLGVLFSYFERKRHHCIRPQHLVLTSKLALITL